MTSTARLFIFLLLQLSAAEILRTETGDAAEASETTTLRGLGYDVVSPHLAVDGPVAALEKSNGDPSSTEEAIHIAFMAVGHRQELVDQIWTAMDNILEFTASPVKFYIIVNAESRRLASLSATVRGVHLVSVDTPELQAKMKVVKGAAERKSKIPVGKLYTCEMLPDVSKVIVLDSDIVVADDIAGLWREFDKFAPTDIAAMAIAQDGFYILHGHRTSQKSIGTNGGGTSNDRSFGYNRVQPLGQGKGMSEESFKGFDTKHPGFNGGVMLQHLDRMREQNFTQLLERMVVNGLQTDFMGDHPIPELRLGDQSMMSEWPLVYPDIGIRMLPNAWNFQLCEGLWTAYKDGPAKLQEFTKLYNYPPKMNDKNAMPSLLHGNCGFGKRFVLAVQKSPHQFDGLLRAWSKHTRRSPFAQGLCNACAMLSGVVQKRFMRSHPELLPRHGLPWLTFGLLGR